MAQADGQFRDSVEDIANLRTLQRQGRNGADRQYGQHRHHLRPIR